MTNGYADFHFYQRHNSVAHFRSSGSYRESVVELVGEQRVGQLPEVELAEGAHRVDVLPEDVSGQVWDLLRVKLVPGRTEEEGGSNSCPRNWSQSPMGCDGITNTVPPGLWMQQEVSSRAGRTPQPEFLDVGGDPRQPVDSIHHPVFLNEFGAALDDLRDCRGQRWFGLTT